MNLILQYLLENNLISQSDCSAVESQATNSKELVEDVLLSRRLLQDSELLEMKSKIFNIPGINLFGKIIPKEILNILTYEIANNYKIIVFNKDGNEISVAMVEPNNYLAKDALDFIIRERGYSIKYYITTSASFNYSLKQYSNIDSEVASEINNIEIKKEDVVVLDDNLSLLNNNIKNASPVSNMISTIINHAIEENASDIHIEPTREYIRVRYRVDGDLYTSVKLPKYMHGSMVSRIKVLAGLKIDENRIPQDGRIRMNINNHFYDFRISIIPISDGEKVVIRILDNSTKAPTLQELGIEAQNIELIKSGLESNSGMIIICGPTGSGKSTTLFSMLSMLNKDKVNIVTLEDPVEYLIQGVNHSQVRPEIGYSFATGIRSFLRQDPDVIMVGEIRDNETAELCVHASLTGHLVLTTLHTNSAIGAIPRLFDMKIEPFLLSSSLDLIISQRLVRKICDRCKTELIIDEEFKNKSIEKIKNIKPDILKKYGINISKDLKFYKGKGCSNCNNTGYKGRVCVLEVLKINDNIRNLIETRKVSDDLEKELLNQNFVSIEQDGIVKALKGLITLEDCFSRINE